MNIFTNEGTWLKGNLHTHTTVSDGQISPEECIKRYKEKGYDFLAITDHNICFKGYQDDKILVIPAVELHQNYFTPRVCYHITGVGIQRQIHTDETTTPQQIIDMIHGAGGFATIAHPEWSLMDHKDIAALKGFDAIEIYNGVSEAYSGRGYSSGYLDVLASDKIVTRITAVDDTHFYKKDVFTGYIMVLAKENSTEAILNALYSNQFYATQAPEIHGITVDEDKKIAVEVSPVKSITFYSDTFYVANRIVSAPEGETITSAEYIPSKTDNYVRIEGIDENGKKVWSNFIDVRK